MGLLENLAGFFLKYAFKITDLIKKGACLDHFQFGNRMELEYETKRTITEVLDVETGEIIKSEDFFSKPESEIIKYRRVLAEAIGGYRKPKFVCAYCNQILKLSGRATKRGEVSFFSHLYDSDECEIKTNGEFSKEEIEIRKYSNVRESLRHKTLKNEIANALKGNVSLQNGVSNVEVEKRVTSNVPFLHWRQPDISAEYLGRKIVFELQLSTTFLSTIIDRDLFYRLNNIFIIWVFNFSDNSEYVNLGNLMCKDIYYANKRNIFIFDEMAREMSKDEGQLVLRCVWFEPELEDGVFLSHKHIKKSKIIRLEDLKFDYDLYKPYHLDADLLYFKFQPELAANRSSLEGILFSRLEKQRLQYENKLKLIEQKNELVSAQKEKIKKGLVVPEAFEKNGRWGFVSEGAVIVEPIYQEVTDFTDLGIAFVKRYNKYGAINQVGDFVLPCDFKELHLLFENQYLFNDKNEWYFRDFSNNRFVLIHKLKDNTSSIEIHKLSSFSYFISIEYTSGILHQYNGFIRYLHLEKSDFNRSEIDVERYRLSENYFGRKNRYSNRGLSGGYDPDTISRCIDIFGVEKIADSRCVGDGLYIGSKYDKWGVFKNERDIIVPFVYDEIQVLENGDLKVEKGSRQGIINVYGEVVIPLDYDLLDLYVSGRARARKNWKFGYIDVNNDVVISFQYDDIGAFSNGLAFVRDEGKYGCVNEFNEVVIPLIYDRVFDFLDEKTAIAYLDKNFGLIGIDNQIVIPFVYEDLKWCAPGRFVARKNGLYGIVQEGNVIFVPFLYDRIDKLKDGKYYVKRDGEYGFLDENGVELYENIIQFSDSYFKGLKFGKYWILDNQSNPVFDFCFDSVEDFVNGFSRIKVNKRYGVLTADAKGYYVFRISKTFKGNYGESIVEYYYGLKNFNHEQIQSPIFNNIEILDNGFAKGFTGKRFVRRGEYGPVFKYKIGLFNLFGDLIVSPDFERIDISKDYKIVGLKNHKRFEYDSFGNCINEPKSLLETFSQDSVHVVTITNIVKYGLFVKFKEGNFSLLHISELKNCGKKLNDFSLDEIIKIKILGINSEKDRLILGLFKD